VRREASSIDDLEIAPHVPGLSAHALSARLVLGLLLLALFAALAYLVHAGPLPVDSLLLDLLPDGPTPLGLRIVNGLASAPVWTAVTIAIAILLAWSGSARSAVWLAVTYITAEAASVIAKLLVARRIPDLDLGDEALTWWDTLTGAYLFPSGHVVRTTVVLGVALVLIGQHLPVGARTLLVIGVTAVLLVVGYARMAAHAHLATDALGGYLLGAASVNMAVAVRMWVDRRAGGAIGSG
jgi:undecaprenyl-diphosphatase